MWQEGSSGLLEVLGDDDCLSGGDKVCVGDSVPEVWEVMGGYLLLERLKMWMDVHRGCAGRRFLCYWALHGAIIGEQRAVSRLWINNLIGGLGSSMDTGQGTLAPADFLLGSRGGEKGWSKTSPVDNRRYPSTHGAVLY